MQKKFPLPVLFSRFSLGKQKRTNPALGDPSLGRILRPNAKGWREEVSTSYMIIIVSGKWRKMAEML